MERSVAESGFRARYTRTAYPFARALGLVLVVLGPLLGLALREILGVRIESRSLMLLTQSILVGAGVLLVVSRYCVTPGVLVSIATMIACLAAMEVVLRQRASAHAFYTVDPLVEVRHRPGKHGRWSGKSGGREFSVEIAINSHGFPDVERTHDKRGAVRIALLGDSFVEAFQVPRERSLARRLQRRLNASGRPGSFEVLNFGVSGYGTAQERFMLEHYALAYDPDVIVVLFIPQNDLHDNLRRYTVGGAGEILPLPAAPTVRKQLLRRIYPRSVRFLHEGLLDLQGRLANRLAEADIHHQHAAYYGVYRSEYDREWEDLWAIQAHAMKELVAVAGGRPVLFVAGACNEQVHPDAWEAVQRAYPSLREHQHDLARPNRLLMQACAALGAHCLDLLPRFLAQREVRLHYSLDGHFNAAGHDRAAVAIHEKLLADGLLPAPGRRPEADILLTGR